MLSLIVVLAGFGSAALVGIAVAKTFALSIAKNAQVTNTRGISTRENVVVNARGFVVYTLSGDSANHPKCTKGNGCFVFWPPVKVASAKALSKASGISGKLAVWHRNGFFQVTLAGHPLYTFAGDKHKHAATGEDLHTFGGTWHVIKKTKATRTTTTSGSTTTMMPTTTTSTPYPPLY
jgi:predicted lipoprotein with Yx(FWY)xxD motif